MSGPTRLRVVINPASGHETGRRFFSKIQSLLNREFGEQIPIEFSRSADHLRELAFQAAKDGVNVFAVGGGDGAAHYALQGLVHTETALGILPVGSGNDIALNLGIPLTLPEAVAVLNRGECRSIDLAQTRTSFFVCIAGVGLDSEANRRANVRTPLVRGRLLYPWALMKALIPFRPFLARVRCDNHHFEGQVMSVIVANAPSYGGGIRIAPTAAMDDGLLDVYVVKAISKLELMRIFPRVYHGGHVNHPSLLKFRGAKIVIETEDQLDLFGDGEYLESTPLQIHIRPGALRVILPSSGDTPTP